MPKRSRPRAQAETAWKIFQFKGAKAARLTVIIAPTAEAAVKHYIADRKITDRFVIGRLFARPQ